MPVLASLRLLPWKLIGWCALGLFIAGLFAALKLEQSQNAKLKAQLHECTTLRHADREAYAKAQADAQAANKADVAAREQRSKQITETNRNAYESDLSRVRSYYEQRLRASNAAPSGASGKPGSPQAGPAPGGADANGLPLSPSDRLQAAEIELRLLYLQRWVRDQLNAQ